MSAKKKSQPPKPVPATVAVATPAPAAPTVPPAATAEPAWIDSPDPRRRLWGKIALVVLWVYVAALWLLALDQWFNWGIFGPKIPPVP
jgi:hypothetical protein